MTLLNDAVSGARMAGQAFGQYVTNPKTIADIGKKVAFETAIGAAASQAIPRMLGQNPTVNPLTAAKHAALHSVISNPISGSLQAMGVPEWASQLTGQMSGTVGSQVLTRNIDPEQNDVPQPNIAQFRQLQQMHANQEQQRYNNEINLALARNYHRPATEIIHRNPSADLQSMVSVLNQKVNY